MSGIVFALAGFGIVISGCLAATFAVSGMFSALEALTRPHPRRQVQPHTSGRR